MSIDGLPLQMTIRQCISENHVTCVLLRWKVYYVRVDTLPSHSSSNYGFFWKDDDDMKFNNQQWIDEAEFMSIDGCWPNSQYRHGMQQFLLPRGEGQYSTSFDNSIMYSTQLHPLEATCDMCEVNYLIWVWFIFWINWQQLNGRIQPSPTDDGEAIYCCASGTNLLFWTARDSGFWASLFVIFYTEMSSINEVADL